MSDWDTQSRKPNLTERQIQAFVDKAADSVEFYAKYFCHFNISPKQKEVVENLKKYQKVISVFNRQGGKTTIMGIYDSHELVFEKYPDGHTDLTIIFAPIKDQSRLIFSKVEGILKGSPFLWSLVDKFQTGGYIKMFNGNELMAKTASPQAHIRGFSPTKIQLEESQDISDVKYYEDILPSGAATDAKIQEIGTPAKRNHFWKTYNHDSTYKKIKQVWTECPFIARDYVLSLLTEGKMTKSRFDQEFNCMWNIDAGSAWPYELISKICVLENKYYPVEHSFEYYAGCDVGKSPAQTVLSIGKGMGDELHQKKLLVIDNPPTFNKILDDIYKPLVMFEPLTCIDTTPGSQGVVLYDMLVKKFTDEGNYNMASKLVPFNYHETNALKAEMANRFEIYGENNRLKLINDENQRRQLIAYEKKTTASNNTVFFSEELTDICQADMMMLEAFHSKNMFGQGGFHFAASGNRAGIDFDGTGTNFSFTKDTAGIKRPDW